MSSARFFFHALEKKLIPATHIAFNALAQGSIITFFNKQQEPLTQPTTTQEATKTVTAPNPEGATTMKY